MRIVAVSDTHSKHRETVVPDGDVLVHAGDATRTGKLDEIAEFNQWLGELPHRHKIVIAGNHDWAFQTQPLQARALLTNGTYLQDWGIVLEGVRFWGSPWQPRFFNWAFNLQRGRPLREKWDLIPSDTDVLVTHGPPWGILDTTFSGEQAGCEELIEAVRRVRPKLHVFGHIHEGRGTTSDESTTFVNACVCDLAYRPVNPPVVIDL